jgi:aminoglycoside phosphotransferase (APT) family kinase protein
MVAQQYLALSEISFSDKVQGINMKQPSLPPDTVPVRTAQKFDESSLERYLKTHLPEFKGPLSILQFEGGQSNPTFIIEDETSRFVLRKKPPGNLLASAHQIEREYQVIKALARAGFPVPEVYLLCEDTDVIGTSFYVMSCIDGRFLRDPKLPGLTETERSQIYESACSTAAQLHQIDWQKIGLENFGRTQSYLARQIARWTKAYQSTRTTDIPSMEKLTEWLSANIPDSDAAGDQISIAHGDFRLENLIFHKTKPEVVAVIDWELSTLGHPLADLGYFCVPYHLPSSIEGLPGLSGLDLSQLGIPSEEGFVEQYARLTHRDGVENFNFFVAFAMFRLAAITQGVKHRASHGNASSERAEKVGALAKLFADTGWKIAREA